jgi:ribosomal protein S27E
MSQPTPPNFNPYAPPQVPGGQPPFFQPPPGSQQFAPCPSCGNTFASKQGFTWWGGAFGPWLFTHVKCYRCGTTYNGKTGRSNNTAIAIYVLVSVFVGIGIVIALGLVGLLQ